MKLLILIVILITAAQAFAQDSVTIGAIDFYGANGLDVNVIRAALPVREGDRLSRGSKEAMVARVKNAIKRATGRETSDVETVCCDDRGGVVIYIGLRGESVPQTMYNPSPDGSARLPRAALEVYRDADEAWVNAMQKAVTSEDDSQGFALSIDPEARRKQLAIRAYVKGHLSIVSHVLASSRNVKHRQIAAEMMGYADRSSTQISALIRASYDVDDGVRNNAIRALAVLARSSSKASAIIPGECFVGLLNSGLWTDRNKSAELLSILTAQRDPQLLTCLREQALTSLVEMARWSNRGHTHGAQLMLGRLAGIDEMLGKQELEPIFNAITTQKNKRDVRPCPLCSALK